MHDAGYEAAKAAFVAGLAHHEAGRLADAEAAYVRSLGLLPGRVSTLVNLAAVRLALARPADALTAADAALAADPGAADAWLHRGTALAELGRIDGAIAAHERLLALAPADARGWSALGNLLRECGRTADAAAAFGRALDAGADPALTAYYRAAVAAGMTPPPAPPAAYVQALFDRYADGFDDHLVERLGYDAHRRLVDGAVALRGSGRWAGAVDLGCGTGLVGALLRPRVDRLVGVDLSARMVDAARARGVYDRLVQADVVTHLRAAGERHDLLLAADVLIYVGDPVPLLAAARSAAAGSGAVFGLSIERAGDPETPFELRPSLRYAHGLRAFERIAAAHGWGLLRRDDGVIRHEQRRPIDGHYVWLVAA